MADMLLFIDLKNVVSQLNSGSTSDMAYAGNVIWPKINTIDIFG